MRISRGGARTEKIPLKMTPMIDIVFLLIIFFMCVTEMSKLEIESLTLPEAMMSHPEGPGNRLTVNVMDDGSYKVSGRLYRPRALERLIAARALREVDVDGRSELAVRIRADAGVPYKYVQRVMMGCRKAKVWQLSFGVAPRGRTRVRS
jgi:biopolymer transport protein ExbD